jgi:AcrR family transcriptional regulator
VPRPRSLALDDVAVAALAVIDRDGLGSLSMRAVAVELGMGTMSLYRYVESREQLEDLVVDRVTAAVDPVVSSRASWSTRVTTLAVRVRDAIGDHPAVVPLLLTRRHRTFGSLAWGEAVLAALADGGLRGRARTIAFRAVLAYVLGAVQAEHLGSLSGPGTAAIADLPPDRYPHLVDAAGHAASISADDEFVGGLDLLLRGMGATPARRRS